MSKVEETVTVVGDLHGQLEDLLHLLNANGMPSNVNKYIFNGDFVDRGPKGVEILVVLFMLMIVYPGSVILNSCGRKTIGIPTNTLHPSPLRSLLTGAYFCSGPQGKS
jgi:hypothetical protein